MELQGLITRSPSPDSPTNWLLPGSCRGEGRWTGERPKAAGNTQHSWKRMLWLAPVYVHIWLIQVFFQHALIMDTDLFSSSAVSRNYPRSGLLAWHLSGTFLPGPKATQNLGRPVQAKAWKLGSMGIKNWKTGSSFSQEQKGLGATGHNKPPKSSFLLCCNHNKFAQHQAPTKIKP